MTTNDPVNHPSHYTQGRIECIEAIQAALGDEAFVAFCRGQALRYAWRAGHKEKHAEDLRKGAWYLTRAAAVLDSGADAQVTVPSAVHGKP